MQDKSEKSIGQLETEMAVELFPKVKDYLRLLADVYAASGNALQGAYPHVNPSLAKQVCTKLLLRLNNDLRCVFTLSEVGYDIQANALAASIYECAFTIATISDTEELAKKWVEHDNPKASFASALSLTTTGLASFGASEDWIEPMYQIYSQFCWGKHLNPIMEMQGGFERDGNILDWIPGPRADELTERGICFSTVYSVLFALIGLEIFVRKHILSENENDMRAVLCEIDGRREELYQSSLDRWKSPDPFPGKWFKRNPKPTVSS